MWIKKRHSVSYVIIKPILWLASKILYGFTPEKYKLDAGKPYLILSNHQTSFDQFMVNLSFPRLLYFVASEDIFSHGIVSSAIKYLVAPIPKSKGQRDSSTIRNCMRVIKEGGAVCIFAEGNRTYSGCTEYIDPVIARFAKSLNATLILYNIEGGYGIESRWGASFAKGKSRGFVKRVISPEEIKEMSNEELFSVIEEELRVSAFDSDAKYVGDKRAEYMERALYLCPDCNKYETLVSEKNTLTCTNCGYQVEYMEDLKFNVINGKTQMKTVKEWYDYQKNYVNNMDIKNHQSSDIIFSDDEVEIFSVVKEKPRELIAKGKFAMYGDRIVLTNEEKSITYPIENVAEMEPLNKNSINMSFDGNIYKIKGQARFNPLKYVNLFYHIKNVSEGL